MKILVVTDDPEVEREVRLALRFAYVVFCAQRATAAFARAITIASRRS